ncbi:putative tetratricopeptide-like helical domain superfamily [Dioscorea sansibarensis]
MQWQTLTGARSHLFSILSSTSTLLHLHQTLALAITSGLLHDPFSAARLVAAVAAADLSLAHLTFLSSPNPSAFSFNSLIRAHSSGPSPSVSLLLFRRMLRHCLHPDRFTFPFLFRAAARATTDPNLVFSLHSLALRHGVALDPFVATSLLHAYAYFDAFNSALKLFDEMPLRTIVTWNAIISCCSKSARKLDGLALFAALLQRRDVRANTDTLVAALSCCKGLNAFCHGRSVHALAIRMRLDALVELSTSLVHTYVKCGGLDYAKKVFDEMPERDVSAWTAMIGGMAVHGRGEEAAELFRQMKACSHCGLVEMGMRIFEEMEERKVVRMEHYGVVVDMLGRAGLMEEAERFVERMGMEPTGEVWGALLNGCLVNGEVEMGKRLERKCVELGLGLGLGKEGGGFLVGVSNVYAREGRWEEVGRVRERMVEKRLRKEKGFSLVEREPMISL